MLTTVHVYSTNENIEVGAAPATPPPLATLTTAARSAALPDADSLSDHLGTQALDHLGDHLGDDLGDRLGTHAVEVLGDALLDPRGPGVRVLCIDDSVANLTLMERVLGRLPDVDVLTAVDGRRGLELAAEQVPDLILLDLHLPDLNGRDVLRRLHDEPATAGIPVAICSGAARSGDGDDLLECGAFTVISKPFDLSVIHDLVDQIRADRPVDRRPTRP